MNVLWQQPWWVLVFFAIGVAGIATAIVSLFFALGRRPPKMVATEVPPVTSANFLESLAGTVNAPLQKGGRATLLNNGDEFYPAMLDAIKAAEQSINFMVYIWEPGEASDQMFDALLERARAGVEVRMLLDGLGGRQAPDDRVEELRSAGGKVRYFRLLRIGKLMRFHKRNHRRAIVIDGRVGFTGGAAVADKWLGNAEDPEHWRESMVRVSGCLATNLQSAFAEVWTATQGEILAGPAFFPVEHEPDGEGEEISHHVHVISSPSAEAHPLRPVFWLSFRAARERLYITSPYFVPDKHLRAVIEERARAGVDVRILLPNERNDVGPVRWASHSYYEELLREGVRIWEYQPTMMHAKQMVVDGAWSVVGSANMDVRSKELNLENVLGILDRRFGKQLESTFLDDLERATEIRLDEWRQRGIGHRVLERVAVLFAEQM